MDYDLRRLGPRNFEHAVQALLRAELKVQSGVTEFKIFGDGKDGGREASWRGTSNLIEARTEWSGYAVLQAKFRARPTGDERDLSWLSGQIKTEFDGWIDKQRSERPGYLLFATNVVLSPVAITGGVDTINQMIQTRLDQANKDVAAENKLILGGWAVWDFDTICRLLEDHQSVRATYGHMVTAGDVLAQLGDIITGSAVSLGPTINSQLTRALRDDQLLRLQQFSVQMNLGEVAVDLPCSTEDGERSSGVLKSMVAHGEHVLRRSAWTSARDGQAHRAIVGGPGQGKSTIGQLLCQIYRLEFLRDRPEEAMSEPSLKARDLVESSFKRQGLPIPNARRWPYLISLGKYADQIADGTDISLIRYIAEGVSAQLGETVTAETIRLWLTGWPWILVLDGLDEVPRAETRRLLQGRIEDFMGVAAEHDADLLIVATTRPQGYDDGFSSSIYQHHYLEKFDRAAVVSYGKAIISALHSESSTVEREMTEGLELALNSRETEKLMGTPLQVMIMTLILERHNRVPSDRYRLFDTYYQTIYERETQKPGPLAQLLSQHQGGVHRLHEQVGLLLHYRNSQLGEGAAAIPRNHLTKLAIDGLREDGFSEERATKDAERFSQATFDRLVLLVPAAGDRDVQFEVRSLQEYMAARWIADCPEDEILDRLATLVPSLHWRHPWVLAAERLLDRRWIRNAILGVLRSADVLNPTVSGLTLPGANRALDLLEADASLTTPAITHSLVAHTLELLSQPLGSSQHRRWAETLAVVAKDESVATQIREALQANLDARGRALPATVAVMEQLQQRTGPLSTWARLRIAGLRTKANSEPGLLICMAQLSAGGFLNLPGLVIPSGESAPAATFLEGSSAEVEAVLQRLTPLPTVIVGGTTVPHPERFGGRGDVEVLMTDVSDEDLARAARALPPVAWPFAAILQSALREREMLAVVTPPGAKSIPTW